MNEIQKFRLEIEDVIDALDTAMNIIIQRRPTSPGNTVAYVLDLFEDAADKQRKAFAELRASMGDKLITEL